MYMYTALRLISGSDGRGSEPHDSEAAARGEATSARAGAAPAAHGAGAAEVSRHTHSLVASRQTTVSESFWCEY